MPLRLVGLHISNLSGLFFLLLSAVSTLTAAQSTQALSTPTKIEGSQEGQ